MYCAGTGIKSIYVFEVVISRIKSAFDSLDLEPYPEASQVSYWSNFCAKFREVHLQTTWKI